MKCFSFSIKHEVIISKKFKKKVLKKQEIENMDL